MEFKRNKGKIMKISIDHDLCIGCGACAAMAPEVFTLGKRGKSEVKDPNASDDESVKIAAESCPVSAISLFEGEKKIWPK